MHLNFCVFQPKVRGLDLALAVKTARTVAGQVAEHQQGIIEVYLKSAQGT